MNRVRRSSAGVLVGLIVLAALACPAAGGGWLTEVAVFPTQPTDGDVIDIFVRGVKVNPGVVGPTPSFFMSDNLLHLGLYFEQVPGIWPQVLVRWDFSLPVGPLPIGSYELTVWAVADMPPFDVMRKDFSVLPQDRIMGDVDLSGYVDDDDLSLLLANWSMEEPDLNGDGIVGDDDLHILLANWGEGGSPAPEAEQDWWWTDDDDLSNLLANWGTGTTWETGDLSGDGTVDDDDLSLLLANWGAGTSAGTGDLNGDGTVNDDDLSPLLFSWGAGSSPAPEAVPEPATLALLAIGGLALIRRRQACSK